MVTLHCCHYVCRYVAAKDRCDITVYCLQSDQVDADIPLPNEPDDRDYQSDDSRNIQDAGSDAGSDDEGEDLQEDAERSDLCGASLSSDRGGSCSSDNEHAMDQMQHTLAEVVPSDSSLFDSQGVPSQ